MKIKIRMYKHAPEIRTIWFNNKIVNNEQLEQIHLNNYRLYKALNDNKGIAYIRQLLKTNSTEKLLQVTFSNNQVIKRLNTGFSYRGIKRYIEKKNLSVLEVKEV